MISWADLRVFCTAHPVGRVSRHAAVLALLACGVVPQCVAAKFHQHSIKGVYLTHDNQVLQALVRRTQGTYWVDGYRMTVSKETQICWHDAPLKFSPILNKDGQPIPRLTSKSPCESAPPANLRKSAWLQYLGIQICRSSYCFDVEGKIVATRIDIWNNDESAGQSQTAHKQNWKTICATASPHELSYPNEKPIDVVCNAKVNGYIESIFSALLRPSAITRDALIAKQEIPSFYVVKPFQVKHNYDFEAIDGAFPLCDNSRICEYKNPHAHSTVRKIVYASDGTVLIPDTVLAHLTNEAEFAALLSYSLAAKDQHLIGSLFSVERLKRWPDPNSYTFRLGHFILDMNSQVLRVGIHQLYLAGYDVRYAAFAWAVEQEKPIKGPADAPNKHMPWFAAESFYNISQFYSDVDYSKLKRGEAEYAQFLDELRKADPDAFEQKK